MRKEKRDIPLQFVEGGSRFCIHRLPLKGRQETALPLVPLREFLVVLLGHLSAKLVPLASLLGLLLLLVRFEVLQSLIVLDVNSVDCRLQRLEFAGD